MSHDRDVPRRDRAVIMARGLSARMGVAKGLLRLSSDGPAFVRIITDLYLDAGFPVDVVTRQETFDAYRGELPQCENLRILSAEGGGDTALTLLIAWRSSLAAEIPCSHFWAHPVDLPLVNAGVVGKLLESSHRDPERIIRPVHQDRPGHPVILPGRALAVLDGQGNLHSGPLRNFLSTTGGKGTLPDPVIVQMEEPGIVRDFDRPEDLFFNQSSAQKEGTHE